MKFSNSSPACFYRWQNLNSTISGRSKSRSEKLFWEIQILAESPEGVSSTSSVAHFSRLVFDYYSVSSWPTWLAVASQLENEKQFCLNNSIWREYSNNKCFLKSNNLNWTLARTTDAQWGNRLHCMAKNQIPIQNL